MVIGEAPGADEIARGVPFVGASGYEFDRQLAAAGWSRQGFFITNVCQERPPSNEIEAFFAKKTAASKLGLARVAGRYPQQPILDGLAQLQADIDEIQPTLILALGNTPFWALTGETGIMRWRGSTMAASGGPVDGHGIKLVCTLHPAFVLRERLLRTVAIADLKRARHESTFPELHQPAWDFTIPHTPNDVRDWFASVPPDAQLSADVENNIHTGSLTCFGFASTSSRAICIPFVHRTGEDPHYWRDADDEHAVSVLCCDMLQQHPICFHNGLHDCQIISKQWGIMPKFNRDSMVMQHVAFPGMLGGKIDPITGEVDKKGSSLSLAFCASLYCDSYKFWKDDGRGWNPLINDEDDYWRYNCEDCCRSFEVMEKLEVILRRAKLWEQFEFEMSLFPAVFEMMFSGTAFDDGLRRDFADDVAREARRLRRWIDVAVGFPLNVGSSKQMMALFYDDLQCEKVLHRKTKKPTLDDKALDRISRKNWALQPLIERIQALRTLDVFQSNFLSVKLREDARLCAAFNIGFVETMRFSSNTDAFGNGFNLQNLPRNAD